MSSKIEVNRETLEARLTEIMQNLTFAVDRNTIREAIALSAAPVVERQLPNGAIENGRAFMERVEQLYSFTDEHGHPLANCTDWQEFVKCFEYLAEHTAPPELGELQATVARLTAENERLKGGQGEPVTMDGKTTIRQYVADSVPEDQIGDEWTKGYEECKRRIHAMFQQPTNSQPAPVSVVLPERDSNQDPDARHLDEESYAEGWNACIEKVKELNQ